MFTAIPTAEEIKKAVFDLDPSSAPGPNSFGGSFYQSCRDIIEQDVVNAITMFFETSWLPSTLNSNLIVLIPKLPNEVSISQYKPIAIAIFCSRLFPRFWQVD